MTITQTVDIPENRRVFLEFPPESPIGRAKVEFTITPVADEPKTDALLAMRGSCKSFDTMESYFARKRADKELEERKSGII